MESNLQAFWYVLSTLRYALRATQGAVNMQMKFNTPDSEGIKHVTSNPDHQYFAPIGVAQKTKRYSTPLGSLDFSIT